MFISIQMLLLLKMDSESRNGESGNGMRRMMVTPGIRGREGQESGGNEGNQGGNARNPGGNVGNQGGNARNQCENAGNQGGKRRNQGGNAGNRTK